MDFSIKGGFSLHHDFKCLKGELSFKIDGRPRKFCNSCGLMMIAENKKLIKHFNGQHKGQEPKFLRYGE